jgi:hypothetical protein
LAKQQAVTQVNLRVASLNFSGDADPVDMWGRPKSRIWKTEAVRRIFRGSRGGMLRKENSAVLETQCSDARGVSTLGYKETKSQGAVLGVGGVHSIV